MNCEQGNSLTRREREVCVLMLLDCNSKEIARRLGGISPRTVGDFRQAVLRTYGVRSINELVHRMWTQADVVW